MSRKIDIINGTKKYINVHHVLSVVENVGVVQTDPYNNNMQMWSDLANTIGNGVKNGCVFMLEHPIIPLAIIGLICISGGYYYTCHYQPWHLEQTQNLAKNVEWGDAQPLPHSHDASQVIFNLPPINIHIPPVLLSLPPINNLPIILRDNPGQISTERLHGWLEGGSVTIILGRVGYWMVRIIRRR